MLVLSTASLTKELRNKLRTNYPEIEFDFYNEMKLALGRLEEAEVLITYGEDLTPELIHKAARLKWIMVISAGMDEMPFAEIKQRNMLVTNAKGIHKIPMAEYAISMLLNLYHQSNKFMENQQKHIWDRDVFVDEISGKTMTIVGTGEIGQEVARLAKAFRMKTIGISQSGAKKDYFDEVYHAAHLNDALPEADFIVSILPSTMATKEFYRASHFQLMKPTAIFLNMGRGDVVSSEILLHALDNNEIAHAVLDVFEQEPLPAEHPLWENPKVTITPHKSSHSPLYLPRAIEIFINNLNTYIQNETDFQNKIDVERGY